ncbi:MAG: hypothetical protein ACPGQL_00730 [Thermoplasmatota archaeon]
MGQRGRRDVGVNLRDLFPQHEVPNDWYHGKRIAVDAHNVAFRYLTSIRGRDGDVLRGDDGRAIGHLLGFLGLVKQFRERGAEPIIIWDGKVHPRKQATVDERIRKREETLARANAAKAAGDHQLYARLMRGTVYLSDDMIGDATKLLEPLGVAVTRADHDGERYAAALCHAGHADAVATEDFDALVAGAPTVLRKAGAAAPFLLHLEDIDAHGLSLDQLRELAIVCGTDWHPGVKGFGPKTAVKAITQYGSLERLFEQADEGLLGSRFHKLVAACDLDAAGFVDLKEYIAALPEPPEPASAKPCPEMATAVAEDMGINPERVLGCFC